MPFNIPPMSSNSLLNALPVEVCAYILTQLPFIERFTCALTCKAWRNAILISPGLWREINLENPTTLKRFMDSKHLVQTASKQVRIVNFTLFSSGSRAQKLVKLMVQSEWSNIKSLSLTNIASSETLLIKLLRLNSETLETLYLENGAPVAGELLESAFNTCALLKNFTYINNGHSGRKRRFRIKSQALRLVSLCIHSDKIIQSDLVPQLLRISPRLRKLELYDMRISRDSIMYDDQQLLNYIYTWCPKILSLSYSRSHHVVNNGMKHGLYLNSDNLELRYYPHIGSTSQDAVIGPWIKQCHSTITCLLLSVCLVKPHRRALKHLSALGLPKLLELELYCLCDTAITDCSAFDLHGMLATCPKLEKIRIRNLDTAGDTALQVLGELDNLRHVEIELASSTTAITSQGIQDLFNEKCVLDTAIFGGRKNYFTNDHLLAVASRKQLRHFGLPSGSCITTEGLCSFMELMQDSKLECFQLGRSPAVANKGIISCSRLSMLKNLELNVFMTGLRVNVILKMFEMRSSVHPLTVQYFNGINTTQLSSNMLEEF